MAATKRSGAAAELPWSAAVKGSVEKAKRGTAAPKTVEPKTAKAAGLKPSKTVEPEAPPQVLRELPKWFKPPKTLAGCADMLYELKEKRSAAQKAVDELDVVAAELKERLIRELPHGEASGVSGRLARVSVVRKEVPKPENWSAIYAAIVRDYGSHMRKKDGLHDGAFALLQRRLGEAAVQEAWKAGKTVDGVGKFGYYSVSINKL